MNTVISKIIEIRKNKGISHEAMALNLDISQVAYSKIEKGETKLTVDRLYKIAEILDTDVTDFFNESKLNIQNQTNNDGAFGNGYVKNLNIESKELYEKIITFKDEQIESLKQEIIFLRDYLKDKQL